MPPPALPPAPDRVDANLLQATGAFLATSVRGEVVETRDIYLANTGFSLVDFNLAFPKRPLDDLERGLARAARYFGERGFAYRVQVRADLAGPCRAALLPRGFTEVEPVPGMCLDLDEPGAGRARHCARAALAIRRAGDPETFDDFRRTAFAGFGLPVESAPLFLTEEFAALPNVAAFVGYVDGEPVSTAMRIEAADVAGIYWVATREGFRGRGYGEALTWEAARAGRGQGCRLASLQASKLGRPVYARMGFVHDRDYARFDWHPG